VFQLSGQVYDLQTTATNQKVTIAFCQSSGTPASVQALIWENSGQPNVLFGDVSQSGVSDTGVLIAQLGSSQTSYQAAAGQPSQFALSIATGALSYSINGGIQVTNSTMSCGTQSAPPAQPISTSSSPPSGYNSALLIFEDRFLSSTLDSTKWIPQIADQTGVWRQSVPAPYSAADAGLYDAEFFDPGRVLTGAGLELVATRDNTFPGYTWRSGCISTHGLFTFQGGYAQFLAKMPDSRTGMWGGLWFLEGGAEIDLQESGFLGSHPNNMMLSNLHSAGNAQSLNDTGMDLSADSHLYGMEYRPGVSIKMFLDGVLMTTYTQNIPTGAFTIVIDLQVAQNAAGWHTNAGSTTPSPSDFNVTDVQVYNLPP
jgi:hypothetical protein